MIAGENLAGVDASHEELEVVSIVGDTRATLDYGV